MVGDSVCACVVCVVLRSWSHADLVTTDAGCESERPERARGTMRAWAGKSVVLIKKTSNPRDRHGATRADLRITPTPPSALADTGS